MMNRFQYLYQVSCVAGLFLAMTGCSSVHIPPQSVAESQHQLDVPFVAQEDDYCGPSSAAMVLRYQHHPADVEQLAKKMILPARSGTLQIELKAALRTEGVVVYPVKPDLKGLFAAVDAGYPVIVLLNLSFGWYPTWHYAVVTGYDLQQQTITVHSGEKANQQWSLTQFENLWARGEHWGIVAIPPMDPVPHFANESEYLSAVVDLERSAGLPVAASAYAAAHEQWPDDLTALIGLGTAAYQKQKLEAAANWYGLAARLHPDSAVAANDYAQTLLDLGDAASALSWAEKAIRLGGGASAEDTMNQILKALNAK